MDPQGIDMVTFIPLVVLVILCFVLAFALAMYIHQETEKKEQQIPNRAQKKETPSST